MVAMPHENLDKGLNWLLLAEEALRTGTALPDSREVVSYWQDLARILKLKSLSARGEVGEMLALKAEMTSDVFDTFISDEISKHETNKHQNSEETS
jgi:hypothetical protein